METPWQPIVDGELRRRAVDTIHEIVAELAEPAEELGGELAQGSAGIALLHAYMAMDNELGRDEHVAMTERYIEHAIDQVAETPMREALIGGFSGVCWAIEHIQRRFDEAAGPTDDDGDSGADDGDINSEADDGESSDDDDGDINSDIDPVLLDLVKTSPWLRDYDLISGLVGIGIYALERLPRASARACLVEILDRLDESARRDEQGIAWHTAPELLPPHQRVEYPEGYYNLGLAHGIPGILGLLGQMCAADVERERARAMLADGLSWLLARQLPAGRESRFSWAYYPGIEDHYSRLAWCYGDPGVAVALQVADAASDHGADKLDLSGHALRLMLSAAQRPDELTRVIDTGLCHGSAGLAHLYNRMYQVSGAPELRAAARKWIEWTLQAREPGPGVRFKTLLERLPPGTEPAEGRGFLTGMAGVALVLLAAVGEVRPDWDRCLMISGRATRTR